MATTVLIAPGAAQACTPGSNLVVTSTADTRSQGPPGSAATVTGGGFAAGPVQVRWGSMSGPLLVTAEGPTFTAAVTIPNVAPGMYYIVASDNVGPVQQVDATFTVQAPLTVFPAMANGAYGGYVTAATIQNTGTAPAAVQIAYFDQSGAPAGAGDAVTNLPPNAAWTVRQDNGHSFADGRAGTAIVYSDQPIASLVNEFAPGNAGDATSYTGVPVPSGAGPTLYAPTVARNAFGGYTTGIGMTNRGSSPTDATVTYRDGGGTVVATQTVSGLAANAYSALYSGDNVLALPNGFAGTATITGLAGAQLAATVNETGPGGQLSSYDAIPVAATSLEAPVVLSNAFGGYNTGMGIQNTSGMAGSVSVAYYSSSGEPAGSAQSFPITADGALSIYQGGPGGPPAGGAYSAVISSTLPLAAIVNEVAPAGSGSTQQSASYNTFTAGSGALSLPLVENAGTDPWNTGEGIMNTGSTSTDVTVTYHDAITGAALGTPQTRTLPSGAHWDLYQPTGGLAAGSRATAVITTAAGGHVAVVANESSATTFMSYDGQ